MGSKLLNLEYLNSKIISSKPAVSSLFVLFIFFLFGFVYFFFLGDAGRIRLDEIDFETSSSQVDPLKKELISCLGSNYASVTLVLH